MVIPVMLQPVNCAMLRSGPPTPQPTSKTLLWAPMPIFAARKYSARLILSWKVSPLNRGAKWKDWCKQCVGDKYVCTHRSRIQNIKKVSVAGNSSLKLSQVYVRVTSTLT